jgi:hypothetical protein
MEGNWVFILDVSALFLKRHRKLGARKSFVSICRTGNYRDNLLFIKEMGRRRGRDGVEIAGYGPGTSLTDWNGTGEQVPAFGFGIDAASFSLLPS